MGQKFKDMTGQRFGRLVCVAPIPTAGKSMSWECICDCGTIRIVVRGNLLSGGVKSCGCLKSDVSRNSKHGLTNGRNATINGKKRANRIGTYSSWEAMRSRCNNPNNPGYHWYGGRGIKVCERWDDFDNFLWDMGERPEGKTLDRIDVNGNYEKSNCKWSTPLEQTQNRRPRSNGA